MTDDELNGWTPEALGRRTDELITDAAGGSWSTLADTRRALMRLIAKHERPPVDPAKAIAREIVTTEFPEARPENEWALLKVAELSARRGLELAGAPHGAD